MGKLPEALTKLEPGCYGNRTFKRAIDTVGRIQPAMDDPMIANNNTYWESDGTSHSYGVTRQTTVDRRNQSLSSSGSLGDLLSQRTPADGDRNPFKGRQRCMLRHTAWPMTVGAVPQ